MCYILKCFGWALDFVQSFLTFLLACLLMCVLCIGVSTAIIAGVAYGYHYSLAEFLTFTRHDVSVYVRRGNFQDRPDIKARRSGDEEDLFPSNRADYQDASKSDTKPLSDTWSKVQDSKNYAEKLNRYSELTKRMDASVMKAESQPAAVPLLLTRIISLVPATSTSAYVHTQTQIIMRNFKPVHDKNPLTTKTAIITNEDDYYNEAPKSKYKKKITDKKKQKPAKSNYIPMRHWGVTTTRTMDDLDDIDEDRIVYKPVK